MIIILPIIVVKFSAPRRSVLFFSFCFCSLVFQFQVRCLSLWLAGSGLRTIEANRNIFMSYFRQLMLVEAFRWVPHGNVML